MLEKETCKEEIPRLHVAKLGPVAIGDSGPVHLVESKDLVPEQRSCQIRIVCQILSTFESSLCLPVLTLICACKNLLTGYF